MRLLVTGSRDWPETGHMRFKVERLLADTFSTMNAENGNKGVTLVVGDCPTGIDKIAKLVWETLGQPVEVFKAHWDIHGKAAGPYRNRRMVMSGADKCLAFPLGVSRGTRGCAAMADAAGIVTHIYEGEHNDGW